MAAGEPLPTTDSGASRSERLRSSDPALGTESVPSTGANAAPGAVLTTAGPIDAACAQRRAPADAPRGRPAAPSAATLAAAVAPIPRLALTQREAAQALGVSVDFFAEHVQHELRCVRRGRKRLFPVAELRRWLDREAATALTHERNR